MEYLPLAPRHQGTAWRSPAAAPGSSSASSFSEMVAAGEEGARDARSPGATKTDTPRAGAEKEAATKGAEQTQADSQPEGDTTEPRPASDVKAAQDDVEMRAETAEPAGPEGTRKETQRGADDASTATGLAESDAEAFRSDRRADAENRISGAPGLSEQAAQRPATHRRATDLAAEGRFMTGTAPRKPRPDGYGFSQARESTAIADAGKVRQDGISGSSRVTDGRPDPRLSGPVGAAAAPSNTAAQAQAMTAKDNPALPLQPAKTSEPQAAALSAEHLHPDRGPGRAAAPSAESMVARVARESAGLQGAPNASPQARSSAGSLPIETPVGSPAGTGTAMPRQHAPELSAGRIWAAPSTTNPAGSQQFEARTAVATPGSAADAKGPSHAPESPASFSAARADAKATPTGSITTDGRSTAFDSRGAVPDNRSPVDQTGARTVLSHTASAAEGRASAAPVTSEGPRASADMHDPRVPTDPRAVNTPAGQQTKARAPLWQATSGPGGSASVSARPSGREGSIAALDRSETGDFSLHTDGSSTRHASTRIDGVIQTGNAPTATPRHVADQIALAVRQNAQGAIEIALDPEELGRLRMTLTPGDSGLSLSVMAERPETLDLIRRHIGELTRALEEAGYADVDLSFAQGDSPAGDGQADTGEPAPSATSGDPAIPGAPLAHPQQRNAGSSLRADGLDIRI